MSTLSPSLSRLIPLFPYIFSRSDQLYRRHNAAEAVLLTSLMKTVGMPPGGCRVAPVAVLGVCCHWRDSQCLLQRLIHRGLWRPWSFWNHSNLPTHRLPYSISHYGGACVPQPPASRRELPALALDLRIFTSWLAVTSTMSASEIVALCRDHWGAAERAELGAVGSCEPARNSTASPLCFPLAGDANSRHRHVLSADQQAWIQTGVPWPSSPRWFHCQPSRSCSAPHLCTRY
jgi:hypothetical protein